MAGHTGNTVYTISRQTVEAGQAGNTPPVQETKLDSDTCRTSGRRSWPGQFPSSGECQAGCSNLFQSAPHSDQQISCDNKIRE